MCGIVGILPTGDRPDPPHGAVRRMARAIEYRGPDDYGEYISESVHLAAVRLSIVDLKNGHQPVQSRDGRISVVFNGEIYNQHELRSELRSNGHELRSQCDTELLPHLIEESSASFVKRLRGMFAIASWDSREDQLTLTRDRLGIKPLYYAIADGYFVFASEIKAIIASGLIEPQLELDSIDDLFSLSYPLPPRTMFRGVHEIQPGSQVVVRKRDGQIAYSRYWRPAFRDAGECPRVSSADAAAELEHLIQRSTYEHLTADVPIATYLSGGLDSAVIAAAVKRVTGDAPRAFSISFDSSVHDESEFAEKMATSLGSEITYMPCGADAAYDFERMIYHTELPLQFPLALPMMRLAEVARGAGYPVVLTGEGADELFGGYDCFRADKMRRVLDRRGLRHLRPHIYRQLYKWHRLPDGTVDQMLKNQRHSDAISREFGGHLPPWYDMWTTLGVSRSDLLGFGGRKARGVDTAPAEFLQLLPPNYGNLHPLDAGLALEQATRLPAWILLIGDRASMAASVEARVPFLDHTVVDFVNGLPPALKMRGFSEKALLRKVAKKWMPRRIATRSKQPFFTPISEWFFGDNEPQFVSDHLSPAYVKQSGIFDPSIVATLRRDLKSAPANHLIRHRLEWTLVLVLGVQVLYRQFIERRGVGLSLDSP